MTTTATDTRADFVRLGYGPDGGCSLQWRVSLPADFDEAAAIISAGPDGYNGYNLENVLRELAPVWPDVSSVEFGREYSPVLYAIVPVWPHQAHGGGYDSPEPFAEPFRKLTACRFLDAMQAAGADELSWHEGPGDARWYTGPESIPDDAHVYSMRAWWD